MVDREGPKKRVFVSGNFISLGLIISIFIGIFFCSRALRMFNFPHSSILTKIYYFPIFDPFLLQFFSFIVLSIYIFMFNNKLQKTVKGIVLPIILLLAIFPTEYVIEELYLKQSFAYNRPVCEAEHGIIASMIRKQDNNKIIIGKLTDKDFRCIEMNKIFSTAQFIFTEQDSITLDKIKNIINKDTSITYIDQLRFMSHYNKILSMLTNYPYSKLVKIEYWINVLKESPNLMREPWLARTFEKNVRLILNSIRSTKRKPDVANIPCDSTPSGYALRQVLILLLSILMFLQPKSETTNQIKNWMKKSLLLLNIIIFIIVISSRVYGFQHTFLDIGIGILIGALIFFIIASIISRRSDALNYSLIASIPYLGFFYFYSQDADKILPMFWIIWGVLSFYILLKYLKEHI